MFNHIGNKIKTLASIATWIGIFLSITIGLCCIVLHAILVGILIIVIGCVASWIGSFLLYGIGQLIDNSDKLVAYYENSSFLDTPEQDDSEEYL